MTILKRVRMTPEARKAQLLTAAIEIAAEVGYTSVNHRMISDAAGCSVATVFGYFNTREELVYDICREVSLSEMCLDVNNKYGKIFAQMIMIGADMASGFDISITQTEIVYDQTKAV